MSEHELWMKALSDAHWELQEALHGLPDGDLWKRPHPNLLSIGELCSQMVQAESTYFLGSTLNSPLVADSLRYYPYSVPEPFSPSVTLTELLAEVTRVHEATKAFFLSARPPLDQPNPHRDDFTWQYTAEYMAFHVAYHTGQIMSVRHLLGHETPDN